MVDIIILMTVKEYIHKHGEIWRIQLSQFYYFVSNILNIFNIEMRVHYPRCSIGFSHQEFSSCVNFSLFNFNHIDCLKVRQDIFCLPIELKFVVLVCFNLCFWAIWKSFTKNTHCFHFGFKVFYECYIKLLCARDTSIEKIMETFNLIAKKVHSTETYSAELPVFSHSSSFELISLNTALYSEWCWIISGNFWLSVLKTPSTHSKVLRISGIVSTLFDAVHCDTVWEI